MPEVTGVKERGGRAKVFLDGELWAEIDASVASEYGIVEGIELDDAELPEIRLKGERALATTRAFNLLSYRARSEGEIRDRLAQHGHSEEVVEEVTSD